MLYWLPSLHTLSNCDDASVTGRHAGFMTSQVEMPEEKCGVYEFKNLILEQGLVFLKEKWKLTPQ